MTRKLLVLFAAGAIAMVLLAPAATAYSTPSHSSAVYEVTITNLTDGQPLSPAVVATHRPGVRLFREGHRASDAIEAIAENGDQSLAVAALEASDRVTDVVDVGAPLTLAGTTVGDFTDSATFKIEAGRWDRLSFASMLICSNDGFTGLDAIKLPKRGNGTVTHYAAAYDAGTERNTEVSEDIVDPCSALGPVALPGDPDGNNNDGIDTHDRIRMHKGVRGSGELGPEHDWDGAIAMVEISLVGDAANVYDYTVTLQNLTTGQPLSPPVVATHSPRMGIYELGEPASADIEAIAENGDNSGALASLGGSGWVTDVVNAGVPLTPYRTTVADFTDSTKFNITARKWDRVSLASMLICTNDGIVGADSLPLPRSGSATYYLLGYDAGTEKNTELSADLVDPCSALGPIALDGDPNGNNNDGIDTSDPIEFHPGIVVSGDLLEAHGWVGPVLALTITRN